MTDKGFDEYGNYGENNPPVGDTDSYHGDANKIMAMITVEQIQEFENGAAEYSFTLNDEAQEVVIELGLSFVMHCAAVNMDTHDALELILREGGKDD